ncbi:hypothetical protein GCM10008957_55490 [Deinococcus ruber]|uniref:Uncharacterized protein n=1 Tax=Deinococcus ruber TaxID=1848197 RepID=A0A918FIC2_9DEIO|nr:hypothetical protein GCM10008957_55490 [Deinococcus ruber]
MPEPPKQSLATPRKCAHGGRPQALREAARLHVYVERSHKGALGLLPGEMAVHVRAAIADYLRREDIAAKLSQAGASALEHL